MPLTLSEKTGEILIVGGGTTPPAAVKRFIEAAGRQESRIVVLAHTRQNPEEDGSKSADLFRENGAINVLLPGSLLSSEIVAALENAKGVWIPGGDQNRFVERLPESSGVPAAIREVWKRGGVVGGASAGASLVGGLMPTGEDTKIEGLKSGLCPVRPGLSLLPRVITDQHFFVRNRSQRLFTAVLELPDFTGIGLDEGTWVTIRDHRLSVKSGQVMLVRVKGKVRETEKRLAVSELSVKILLPPLSGEPDTFQLK